MEEGADLNFYGLLPINCKSTPEGGHYAQISRHISILNIMTKKYALCKLCLSRDRRRKT